MHTEIAQGSVFARTIPGFVDVNILSGLLFYKDDRTAGFVYHMGKKRETEPNIFYQVPLQIGFDFTD
jgi:hypothetical protein